MNKEEIEINRKMFNDSLAWNNGFVAGQKSIIQKLKDTRSVVSSAKVDMLNEIIKIVTEDLDLGKEETPKDSEVGEE